MITGAAAEAVIAPDASAWHVIVANRVLAGLTKVLNLGDIAGREICRNVAGHKHRAADLLAEVNALLDVREPSGGLWLGRYQ